MISQDKRKAIYLLHEEGMGIRAIGCRLNVNRGTVRAIIEQKGIMPDSTRKDQIELNPELLQRLYKDCHGFVQRVHEKLSEEEGIEIGYSTLTRKMRELGLGKPKNGRREKVLDIPGDEMQHDTSPYLLKVGEKRIWVQASLLYYRYSKIRY
jgi:transposase